MDSGNNRIEKFTQEGVFLREWGSSGTGDGEFDIPIGIAVNSEDIVYVTDGKNHRVQYFTSSGDFLGKFGGPGSGESAFNYPSGISIDGLDSIYIADTNNYRIQKFDSNHTFIYEFGSAGAPNRYFGMAGSSVSANNHGPFDVAVDAEGRIYVLDTVNNRIQVFGEDSELSADVENTRNSDGWYPYGTRVSFDVPEGETLTYQWVGGESDENGHEISDSRWQEYDGSFKTREGRYTLYWRISGDDTTYSRYFKTKEEKKIRDIHAALNLEDKNVKLTWDLKDTGNSGKVEIYRNDLIKDYDLDAAHLIGTNAWDDFNFTDRFLTSWHDYYYKIAIYDDDGDLEQVRTIFVHIPEIPEQ